MSQSRSMDTERGMEDKEGEKKEDGPDTKQEKEAFTGGDVPSSSSSTPTETASTDAEISQKVPSEQPKLGSTTKKRKIPQTAQALEVASESKSEDATSPERRQADDVACGKEDKEGEKKEDDSDTIQEKQTFTSGDVSSPSSSTPPTQNVSIDVEMSEKVPSEQPYIGSPLKKRKTPQTARVQEVASESESEDATSPERAQAEDEAYESNTGSNSPEYTAYDYTGRYYSGMLLFEVQLTKEDVKTDRLLIHAEDAADHFPSLQNCDPKTTAEIEVTDTKNNDWVMTLSYHSNNHAFLLTNGWRKFFKRHKLVAKDWVRVYRPEPRKHHVHFLVECVKGRREQRPEFNEESCLFKVELKVTDVTQGRLVVPREEVKRHFPAINLPEGRHLVERMRWTDENGRDWTVNIFYAEDLLGYMVLDGWETFAKEHELKAMDVVTFYRPRTTLNPRHALVKCEKRRDVQGRKDG